MTTPFAPIDAATMAALNKGDEKALESIFRSHHDVLIERALERLKDEKAAVPRLVAAVIREVWHERAAFKTSAELEGFINEELRNRARAVRSRMAAVHRFEKSEGVTAHAAHASPTVDQLWQEIHAAMHQPALDPAAAAKQRRAHAAHDAAHHISGATAARNWRAPALFIGIAAVAIGGFYVWAAKASKVSTITQLLASADAPVVPSPPGKLASFTLADSSTIRLGADSRFIRVQHFGREYRAAAVFGAANVAVRPGHALPFEVRLGNVSVTSQSSGFAVRDYPDEPMRYVKAHGDGVMISGAAGERTLSSGQTVAIGRDSVMRDATAAESAVAFGWLDGKLVLSEVAVRDALKAMYRWYAVDIGVRDTALLGRRVSIDVPLESSQIAIGAMETGAKLKFEWDDTRMMFRDAAAPPTKAPARRR